MKTSDPKAYRPFTTDKGVTTRTSSYTERFHKKYPGLDGLAAIADATGIPKTTLKTVYNRGMAAWRTGHRPGASQQAWGMARVYSFVLHGKTYRTADADLAKTVKGGGLFDTLRGVSQSPPTTAVTRAELKEDAATTAQVTGQALRVGATTAAAVGLATVAAAGPALPAILGLGILAAAGYQMYAQNQKLAILFTRTATLTKRMGPIVEKLDAAKLKNIKLQVDTTVLKQYVLDIQTIIGELLGPTAYKEIEGSLQAKAKESRTTLYGKLARYGRILVPATTIARFNERLILLGIEFSVLLGEFTFQIEKEDSPELNALVDAPPGVPPEADTKAAETGAAQPSQNSPPA
jgi:hypothetical protein